MKTKDQKNFDLKSINFQSLMINRRYLLLSIGGGLVSLLILFMGLIPTVSQSWNTYQDLQTEKKELAALERKVRDLSAVNPEAAFGAADEVSQVLPSRKPLLELLATLSGVSGENNVQITELSLSPGRIASESAEFLSQASGRSRTNTSAITGYDALQVELQVRGSFRNVQDFFLEIEKSAPLTTISSLSLEVDTDDIIQPDDPVDADLVLRTFYFTRPISASLAAPLPQIKKPEEDIIAEILQYRYPSIALQQQIVGGGLEDLFGEVTQLPVLPE